MSHAPESPAGAPIEPGSLLYENAGRWYNLLTALPGGTLQLMYPGLGAGVTQHSRFFQDPGERLANSIEPILDTIYSPEPETTGHMIRDIHKGIKGTDDEGRVYRALDADRFWWAHATFEDMVAQGINRFSGHPLSQTDREQLNRESVTWYSLYGLSMRPVPADLEEFQHKWDDTCQNVLEMSPAAERTIGMFQEGDIESFVTAFNVNPAIWKIGRKAISEMVRVFAIGGLPETVRERLDIPFSEADKKRLEAQDTAVRGLTRITPPGRLYLKAARQGMKRSRA